MTKIKITIVAAVLFTIATAAGACFTLEAVSSELAHDTAPAQIDWDLAPSD